LNSPRSASGNGYNCARAEARGILSGPLSSPASRRISRTLRLSLALAEPRPPLSRASGCERPCQPSFDRSTVLGNVGRSTTRDNQCGDGHAYFDGINGTRCSTTRLRRGGWSAVAVAAARSLSATWVRTLMCSQIRAACTACRGAVFNVPMARADRASRTLSRVPLVGPPTRR
jgi:hypothetical protein